MAISLSTQHSSQFSGLDTYTYTAPGQGLYKMSARSSQIPSSIPLTLTINVNGSPVGTLSLTGPQSEIVLTVQQLLSASDVVTWVLTSSASPDYRIQNIRTVATIDLMGN